MSPPLLTFGFLCIWFSCQVSARTFQQSPAQIVKESAQVQITCRHDDNTLPLMLWYQQRVDSLSMTLIGYGYANNPQNYEGQFKEQLELTREDAVRGALVIHQANQSHSAVYFCAARQSYGQVYFGAGTKLTVLEPDCEITKPTVQVLPPAAKECRDQKDNARKKTIVCVATRFYPDHVQVSWQINGNSVTNGVATDEAALREDKFYKITSRLRVLAKEWYKPDTKFTCTVSFFDGTETTSHSDSINGEEAKGEALTKEKYLRITQTAKFSYSVFIIKSITYGAFVGFLVWKLQSSAGKQNN